MVSLGRCSGAGRALSTVLVEEDMVRGSRAGRVKDISRWQSHSVLGGLSPAIDYIHPEFLKASLRDTVVQVRKLLLKVTGF